MKLPLCPGVSHLGTIYYGEFPVFYEFSKKTFDKCVKFSIWNVFFQQKFAKLEFSKENQTQKNNYNNIVNNLALVLGFGVPVDCSQQKAELFL